VSDERPEESERSALDEALDLFVYAPIGMALTAAEELPEMIRKGREAVEVQMGTAKVIGRVAVNQGKVEVNRLISQWNDLGTLLRSGVMSPPRPQKDKAEEGRPAPATSAAPAAPPKTESVAPIPPAAKRVPPPPDDLGIPGYASLSASQVVSRLTGLSAAQLDAVKEYEGSTRRRRTILNRVEQLQSDSQS
jgi:hypothetical protein